MCDQETNELQVPDQENTIISQRKQVIFILGRS